MILLQVVNMHTELVEFSVYSDAH